MLEAYIIDQVRRRGLIEREAGAPGLPLPLPEPSPPIPEPPPSDNRGVVVIDIA